MATHPPHASAPPSAPPSSAADAAYSIRLDKEEQRVLCRALDASRASCAPRLLREVRRLHQLYSQLSRLGFGAAEVEECLAHARADATLADCLDWCVLRLDEQRLPAALRVAAAAAAEESAPPAQTSKAKLASEERARVAAEKERERQAALQKAAEEKAKGEARRANFKEWTKQYAQRVQEVGSSDEEDELTDQLGVLELIEVDTDKLEELMQQKRTALDELADDERQERRARRLQRHLEEIAAAIDEQEQIRRRGGKKGGKKAQQKPRPRGAPAVRRPASAPVRPMAAAEPKAAKAETQEAADDDAWTESFSLFEESEVGAGQTEAKAREEAKEREEEEARAREEEEARAREEEEARAREEEEARAREEEEARAREEEAARAREEEEARARKEEEARAREEEEARAREEAARAREAKAKEEAEKAREEAEKAREEKEAKAKEAKAKEAKEDAKEEGGADGKGSDEKDEGGGGEACEKSGGGSKASSKKRSNNKKKPAGGATAASAAAARAAAMARYQTKSVEKPAAPPPPQEGGEAAASGGDLEERASTTSELTAAEEAEAEEEALRGQDAAYDLSGWTGKTPKTMLLEWFQKRQQPRPRIEAESYGRRYRAAVIVAGGGRVELPEGENFDKRDQAEQAAATAALLHLFPEQPLYRLLPPSYRSLWLKWAAESKRRGETAQREEAAAALLAREAFVQAMASRPLGPDEPIRVKKQREAEGEAEPEASVTPPPMDEAARARARQVQRELEEEEMDRQEALEQEQRRKRERQTIENARLQVALERFHKSEAGVQSLKFRESLPIINLLDALRTSLALRQVALVCGETGSGKSTQVPQMVLEHEVGHARGGECFILCTQPRRIAAVSLARRVAAERGEQVGGQVGYTVRLDSKRSDATRVLFCTTGIALRMMLSDNPMENVSHIVVDEVHERDAQTDLLILLIRELLPQRPQLRVLLMSATLQAETFSRYFDDCPVLSCKGRSFPVTEHFLEDVLEYTDFKLHLDSPCRLVDSNAQWQKATFKVHGGRNTQYWQEGGVALNPDYEEARYASKPEGVRAVLRHLNEQVINHDLISDLLAHIDDHFGEGAVLIFLPGIADISTLLNGLQTTKRFGNADKFRLLPLHSSLSPADQSAVFDTMPPGVRKVVLATNIAETSITIDDAVFVIDTGRAKQSMFDERKNMRRLVDVWISQAEARQRAGRAGRVRAGHVFKLYTRFRSVRYMEAARKPEMLRGPLQELCLQLRLSPLLSETPLRSAFSLALDEPPEAAVTAAISSLQRTGALDADEQLTPLGRHLAALPVDVATGRLILFGALLRCAEPILLIAAALSDRSPFLAPFARRDEARAAQLTFNSEQSDHLAVLEAHRRWEQVRREAGAAAAHKFCERHFLSERTLQGMSDAAQQYWGQLAELGLLPSLHRTSDATREALRRAANENADNPLVLKAVLCAGLFPNVLKVQPGKSAPVFTQQKQSVTIHPSSFNKGQKVFETGWLCYHEKVATSGKIFVHDCTAVSALDLMLFGAEPQILHTQHRVLIDGWIDLRMAPRTAVLCKALRQALSELMTQRIADTLGQDVNGAPAASSRRDALEGDQPGVLQAIVWLIARGTATGEGEDGGKVGAAAGKAIAGGKATAGGGTPGRRK